MSTPSYSEAPSETDRIVELREDLFFATDSDSPVNVTTVHGQTLVLKDWSWTGDEIGGVLAEPLDTIVDEQPATLAPGFELTLPLSIIRAVVNV